MVKMQEARSKDASMDLKDEHGFEHRTSKHGITRNGSKSKSKERHVKSQTSTNMQIRL